MNNRMLKEEHIVRFVSYLQNDEKSENTIEKYSRDIRAFLNFASGKMITKNLVIAYKNKLVEDKYAVSSINSMLAAVNSLLSFLDWTECRVKFIRLQRQIFFPKEKELTKKEYVRLVKTARMNGNIRLSLLIQTICSSGIRVSELQYITVEAVKNAEAIVTLKGKTRSVFIIRELQKKLLDYAAQQGIKSGSIFVTRNGKPLNRINVWREMKNLCQQAHVNPKKVFPHNLRHLFARTFYAIDKDIAKLADILGHSSINTTRIYIMTTCNEHQNQLSRLRLLVGKSYIT